MKHAAFPIDELAPGRMRAVTVSGISLVIARAADGTVRALRDRCPHAGAPLSRGRLIPRVDGDDVDRYEVRDELVLRCPWHGYEFDLASGACLADPKRVRVRAYRVTVENGVVFVDLQRAQPSSASTTAGSASVS